MKEIISISVNQLRQWDLRDNIKKIAEFLDVKCEIKYEGMSFGFPFNTCHYRLFCEAEEENMSKFKNEIL